MKKKLTGLLFVSFALCLILSSVGHANDGPPKSKQEVKNVITLDQPVVTVAAEMQFAVAPVAILQLNAPIGTSPGDQKKDYNLKNNYAKIGNHPEEPRYPQRE